MKPEIKGFELSTDYKELWRLIHEGFRIPAWILYSRGYDDPIYDLVEVKTLFGQYRIGVRGIGYEGFSKTIEEFESICKKYELRWVKPQIQPQ
ncbi:MAG: hypothetical protein A2W93_14190 [Bacteroidetes bacterium GWF2_43_63]|nr:MAG: hypothetical protein A2W94_00760 [Bacteroidetes bacterium GWE2_42_42]OFY52491.1 MAG: hypothetical protein A2W93_14190 [Bacteroidetes bacterium GWF2_43_63]HBG71398.1 hypothetical protein [Bacteroidales bacterium]HCB60850.1 hypothetical protein [Bacteroidales bacterium]HCY23425.1 hypothetical protein [Bacteroidales bacterium]